MLQETREAGSPITGTKFRDSSFPSKAQVGTKEACCEAATPAKPQRSCGGILYENPTARFDGDIFEGVCARKADCKFQ